MKKRLLFLCAMGMVLPTSIHATSMVYNFRIAQITKQDIFNKDGGDKNYSVVALLFNVIRKKYHGDVQQYFLGTLDSFIYDFRENYYFRTDFAVSAIKEKTEGITTFHDVETDDLLFSLGRNLHVNDKASLTFTALLGLPTHVPYRLRHLELGLAQVGIGGQLDGSYAWNSRDAFLFGARYVYFVPRTLHNTVDQQFRFTYGNMGDVLVAYKHNWPKKHGIEFGYTTKFRFGAHIHPFVPEVAKKSDYIRSNWYSVYKYRFAIKEVANKLLFNIAYGFDHQPHQFGNKYIVTIWGSWIVNF
ncbi:MAG: hypothetical protein WCE21_03585 [Candidatus Babeliales bacterium]